MIKADGCLQPTLFITGSTSSVCTSLATLGYTTSQPAQESSPIIPQKPTCRPLVSSVPLPTAWHLLVPPAPLPSPLGAHLPRWIISSPSHCNRPPFWARGGSSAAQNRRVRGHQFRSEGISVGKGCTSSLEINSAVVETRRHTCGSNHMKEPAGCCYPSSAAFMVMPPWTLHWCKSYAICTLISLLGSTPNFVAGLICC